MKTKHFNPLNKDALERVKNSELATTKPSKPVKVHDVVKTLGYPVERSFITAVAKALATIGYVKVRDYPSGEYLYAHPSILEDVC